MANLRFEKEINSLLEDLKPYKFNFDGRPSKSTPSSPRETISIRLNEEKSLLCLEFRGRVTEIKNDNKIIEEKDYNSVRTKLQNQRNLIPEDKWDENFKLVKQQILAYLIKEKKIEDREGFVKEFQSFVDNLPGVPHNFIDCCRQLKEIDFDDWEIVEGEENDDRLRALGEIHKNMLESLKLYKDMGEKYIEARNIQAETNAAEKAQVDPGINEFNAIQISGDGDCFYAAFVDQLRRLDNEIESKKFNSESEGSYTHQELKELALDFIRKNKDNVFGLNLEKILKDIPDANINTIDQYIEFHTKKEAHADTGIIQALCQVLDVTVQIYHEDYEPIVYNAPKETAVEPPKLINLQYIDNQYKSLIPRQLFELLPFETKYPKQSYKVKRIFEILNKLERGDQLDQQLEVICKVLQLSQQSFEKLKGYLNAHSMNKTKREVHLGENLPWYTDEDMNIFGRALTKYGVNLETQFYNRLTEDGIKTLPSFESLQENHPRYICYNIGGKGNKDKSGIHWISILLVKRENSIKILYKDPKGDWNINSESVEDLFRQHYGDKVKFIKHYKAEQKDDSSCGPMTINNLEIMAKNIENANNEGKDGIAELIESFQNGKMTFTTQSQVENIRITHSLQRNATEQNEIRPKEETMVDDLETIIAKLEFFYDDALVIEGKNYKVIAVEGKGDCFYAAVADQIRRLHIEIKLEADFVWKELKELTLNFIETSREDGVGYNFQEILTIARKEDTEDELSNIETIDQYIELHSGQEKPVDRGIIEALAQILRATIQVYNKENELVIYNPRKDIKSNLKRQIKLQYSKSRYNSVYNFDITDDLETKKKSIKSCIEKIGEYYENFKNWNAKELRNWSGKNKGKLNRNFNAISKPSDDICEAIAVMDRANELATNGQRLRDTQKCAILIFMQTSSKGHIGQINTGEGKTTIVSIVQALKVMQGYKGHVITSNNVLASDAVKDKGLFFKLLNITVAHNNPDEKYTQGPRACYSKDVVYGSITSFQFDWLRDSFEQLKTMEGIDFNNIWVMLDEIDSLLVDQGGNIAKLSGPFPGMESLRYVYINIWASLVKTEKNITEEISVKLKTKANDLYKDSETQDDEKQRIYDEYKDNLRDSYLDEIKIQMKKEKNNLINKKIIAKHLHQYTEDNLEKWIENAFLAKYEFKENVEYKISKDKDGENIIIPVDNQNTGVSMTNTILSNGLHQFLQLKHNLCVTYESLISSYVSNLDYIKMYGSKLSGVTGTLGSQSERNLLASVFNIEFSIVPPFKSKQFRKFPGKICPTESFGYDVATAALGELTRTSTECEYLEESQEMKFTQIQTPRAVLIVCASIFDVDIIASEIEEQTKAAALTVKVRKYRDESNARITENTLDIGDIVVATNLAGRGTDFKTSSRLESNGGLHVIEAFLPCNKRVEDQGFGRTSRQGNHGTGQIIVKLCEVEALGINSNFPNEPEAFDEVIRRRDDCEKWRLNDLAENKIIEMEFKGKLFNKFSSEYGSLKRNKQTGPDTIKWTYVLKDLKEKWAFWLEKQSYNVRKIKELIAKQKSWLTAKAKQFDKAVEMEYKRFRKEAKPIIDGIISHNPYYSICLSERYLKNCTNKSDRDKAASHLRHAIEISGSSDLLYSAYMKLFEIAIENGGQVLQRYQRAVAKIFFFPLEKTCPEYKTRALENLQSAAKALAIEYDYLDEMINGRRTNGVQQEESTLSLVVINGGGKENPNIFLKHLQARYVSLGAFKGNIESLIKQLNGEEDFGRPEGKIGPTDGVILDSKVPKYLRKLDSENDLKKYITERSVNELEYIGMSSIYQLRKIHDVHEEVITGAQIQIGGACALLAAAVAFPVLLPVNGPLAGAMISEGITDIITALIQQGQSAFNTKDYVKGKVISYGITILTMGIGALMSSSKILTKAMNACRSLATKLRSVRGPFALVCRFLASVLEKIALHLEQIIEKIEFAKKTAAEQAKYLCQLKDAKQLKSFQQLQKTMKFSDVVITKGRQITQIVTQAAIGAIKGVVISVAIERIVIASLTNMMDGLKPIIQEKVENAVSIKIQLASDQGAFNSITDSGINQTIRKLSETTLSEDVEHVSKEIALGILRHSSNWKMQIAALAVQSVLVGAAVHTYANRICEKFISQLPRQGNEKNEKAGSISIGNLIIKLSEEISGTLYRKIVEFCGKVVVTLPKALYKGYKEYEEKSADKKAIAQIEEKINLIENADNAAKSSNAICAHDAVAETLGLDKAKGRKHLADATNLATSEDGASIEDAKKLFFQNGIEVSICGVEDAHFQFEKQNSDRGVVCLSGNQVPGHAVNVTMENNRLMVKENGRNIPLDQYKQSYGFTKAEFIIPKGVNASSLPEIQHGLHRNRIVRATHTIDYVGQDGDAKFGKVSFTFDSIDPKEKGKMTGHPRVRFLFNSLEGNSICDGASPAHTLKCHVGKVNGKSSFKDKNDLYEKFGEAMLNMRQKKDVHKIVKDMPTGNGIREEIVVKVSKFKGYNDMDPFAFQYITIVRDKPEGRHNFLVQTCFPCKGPKDPAQT